MASSYLFGWLDYQWPIFRPQRTLSFWVNETFLDSYQQILLSNDLTKIEPRHLVYKIVMKWIKIEHYLLLDSSTLKRVVPTISSSYWIIIGSSPKINIFYWLKQMEWSKCGSKLRAKQITEKFEWPKVYWKCQKWSMLATFWKPEACSQTVLPDRPLLMEQKLVENT